MGELLGLTWDCIDISEDSIKNGCAYIFVNKELQRVNRNALEQLGEKGVSKDVFTKAGLISCLDYYNERHALKLY